MEANKEWERRDDDDDLIKKSKTVIKPQFWSLLLSSCFHLGLGDVEIFARRKGNREKREKGKDRDNSKRKGGEKQT